MTDSDKSKQQLMQELRVQRARLVDLEVQEERATAALRDSEERFHLLLEASFEGIVIHDKGTILLANALFAKTLGYDVSEVIGMQATDFTAPESHETVIRQIRTRSEEKADVVGKRRDGSTLMCEIRGCAVQYEGKEVRMVALRDVSDRWEAEQARENLQESEHRFRMLFDGAPDAIFIADTESGVILDANAAASKLLQRPQEDIVGLHQADLHPPSTMRYSKSTFDDHVRVGSERGFTDPIENEIIRSDGSTVPVEVMANVVEFGGQHLIQGTFRDISDRKKTESALRESETKYRTLFEQSSDAIYLSARGGRLLDLNEAGAALFGYSREEMLSLDVANLYLDPNEWKEFVEVMGSQGAVREYEATGVKKDGSPIDCLVTVSPWCSEDGTVRGYQGLVRDVTEQRRAEDELRQSEERFRTLVHHAPEAIVLWNLETGKFVDANANAERLFGLPRKRLLELGPFDVSPPFQPDGRQSHQVTEFVEAVVAGETPVFEWLHCTADGKEVLCEVRLVRLPGEQPLVRGSMTDITERKRAEEALRVSLERFRAIFESAAVAIVVTRADGAVLQCNSAWERMAGFTADEIRGKGFLEFTYPDDVDVSSRVFRELAEGEHTSVQLETRYVAKDGSTIWGSTSVSTVHEQDGKLKYNIAMIENITERKQAEVELKSSREKLRNLTARLQAVREEERTTIAREIHDELGQSLTGLKMDLSWIADRLPESGGDVRERARSMLSLIDIAANSVRKLSTRLRPAILDDLGLEAAIEWQASEFSAKATVECHLDLRIGDLDLEPERATAVFRILQETLTNVARHAGANGVWVKLCQTDSELILAVKDDGRGISDSEVASPRSLGLIGMRERALAMGGHVEIGREPSGGTEVLLHMPIG